MIKFDDGEGVTSDLDLAAIRRPGLEQRRVNVDSPLWMIESLDRERRQGVVGRVPRGRRVHRPGLLLDEWLLQQALRRQGESW